MILIENIKDVFFNSSLDKPKLSTLEARATTEHVNAKVANEVESQHN